MMWNRTKQCLAVGALAIACASMGLAVPGEAKPASGVDFLQPAKRVVIRRDGKELSMPSAREALAAAKAGDTILLGAGTHAGPLVIKTDNITLTGEPGARINGNDADWKPAWTPAPEFGEHAYTTPIPWQPITVAIDGRVMIDAEEGRGGLGVHKLGSGRNGRDALGGVFTYQGSKKRLVVSFATAIKPADHTIEATRKGESAVTIQADNCIVENLAITGGVAAVLFEDANHSTVRNCLLYGADSGAKFGKDANHCRILNNDITWNQDSVNLDADPETADVGNDVWHTHKKFGTYDKFGINIEASGEGNEIAGNYIYNVWNGITSGAGIGKDGIEKYYKESVFKGISKWNRGLKVHHNRLDLTLDDALEPDGEAVDNEWNGNVVTRARCATRIKTIAMGPLFFYDNVLTQSSDGLRLYKSMPEQANVYIFHNAIDFSAGVIYHEMNSVAWNNAWLKTAIKPGTPSFWIFNNVFLCKMAFAANTSDSGEVAPNFKGDHNLFTSSSDSRTRDQGIDAHSLFNAAPQMVDAENGDYRLKPGSPGTGAGADLGTLPLKAELPARLREVAAGRSPDIGLLPATSEKAPRGPVTPIWAMAEKQLNLGERDLTGMPITPARWIAGPKAKYVVTDYAAGKELTLQLARSSPTNKSGYTITITDLDGNELLKKTGVAAEVDGMTLKVPASGKSMIVTVDDDRDTALQLTAEGAKVGLDATTETNFKKFDGTPMVMRYTPAGTQPVTFAAKSKYGGLSVTVVDPSGASTSGTTVKIDPQVGGTYKVLMSFTKAASIRVQGGGLLEVDPKGETIELRPMWGKPKF